MKPANKSIVRTSPLIGFTAAPESVGRAHASPAPDEALPENGFTVETEAVLGETVAAVENPLVSLARHFHTTRRAANEIFGDRVISDPQYDMLLELFIAHHEGRALVTTDLCRAAGVPATTALRYIDKLEAGGLLRRLDDPADARKSLVIATDKAVRSMTELMAKFRNSRHT